jgi:multimeric flavodoxin WrbA
MRFLFINGCARKGNTWKLAELVQEDLKAIDPQVEIEEIHLMQVGLPFCVGCSNCFRVGVEKCPHASKVQPIIEAIDRADGVIITSTTYVMRETALLKNFFDHLSFMMHRPHFYTSRALVITTTGGVGAKSAGKSIAETLYGAGFNRCRLFARATISWNDYQVPEKTKLQLHKVTEQFAADCASKKLKSPLISSMIPYNLFRGMSLSYVEGTSFPTEDGIYWTQPERAKRTYDRSVPVSFYKKPLGHLFYFIGKYTGGMKSMLVTYKN